MDNRTHHTFAYRRIGRKWGRLRWSGMGYIGSSKKPEDIAALCRGEPVDAALVRKILAFATAHVFVEMIPYHGGTGYYCLLPKDTKTPRRVPEPDDPREDDPADDEILPEN